MVIFTDTEFDPHPGRRRSLIGWTLLALGVVGATVLASMPAPYVIEQPGPVYDVLGKVEIDGKKVPMIQVPEQDKYPTEGSLDMLTVTIHGSPGQLPSWLDIAGAYLDETQSVVPVEAVYQPGVSLKQANREAKADMVNSQKEAIAAALHELGYEFPSSVEVDSTRKGFPAENVLAEDDVILTVNGNTVADVTGLRAALAKNGTEQTAELVVRRDGKQITLHITPTLSEGREPVPIVGIIARNEYRFPVEVKIQLENVGGPSAGMMFAIGIIDRMTEGPINGGEEVAGTGTIDSTGTVGGIGGIRQKLFAARDAGATWFLAPEANCDEVTGHIPDGLTVFAVGTLDDALEALETIRSGGDTAALPSCPID